jgi:hypothetical protein
MGRKRAKAETPAAKTEQITPHSSGANRGKQAPGGAASKGGQSAKRGDKTQAVRQAVAEGILVPKDIVDYVRREHGLEISPSYASGLKNQLLKEQRADKRRAGRNPQQEGDGDREGKPASTTPASPSGSGLTPQDLAALGELAERVGGIDRLQEFLGALKRIR